MHMVHLFKGIMSQESPTQLHPPTHAVYPIYLTGLDQVLTVVVGGGPIAERKVKALLDGGAQVRLIAPSATPQLQAWATAQRITWLARPYQPGDLEMAFLTFAITDQRQVNAAIAAEAQQRRILCNVADRAEDGNFHTPATLRLTEESVDDSGGSVTAAEFVFAIGSTGKRPKRVKQLRDWLRTQWEACSESSNPARHSG